MWPQRLFMVSAEGKIAFPNLFFLMIFFFIFLWGPKADPKNFLSWPDEPIQGLWLGSRNSKFEDAAKGQH